MPRKKLPSNEELIKRLRSWNADYVVRSTERVSTTGEVFTPTELVNSMLDKMPNEAFIKPEETFCDPCCGNGQFLAAVLLRKLESGIDFETALSTIYGVDIMLDNVKVCQDRLLCGVEELRHVVEKNIVCADALKYDFKFE